MSIQTLPPPHRPHDRYLPPPRPSSNLSTGYYHGGIPTRPTSNVSNQPFAPPPPRTHSGMSNGYGHSQVQAKGGAEYTYLNGMVQQFHSEDPRRTASRASQHQRQLPPPPPPPQLIQAQQSRPTLGAPIPMPPRQPSAEAPSSSVDRRKKEKSPVDWVEYFGGKPPTEIITIHDDDSPAPPVQTLRPPPPPQSNGTSTAQHVDKKRRVNGGEAPPAYSATNTPYSHPNGSSSESLQTTTAQTSVGSNVSGSNKLDGPQTGQKRKRPSTRTSEQERKKQEIEDSGPRGYLAEYGEYVPPQKQHKKQRDVVVRPIKDVRITSARECVTTPNEAVNHSVRTRTRRLMTKMVIISYTKTAG